ncbi:DNA repair protein rhp26 [Penicillium macrosclerotiorum]|uniref:DNA repair protein rhp26 n=1 Tax=Penicillium macrosclerotiorum TaxID=303699 RepID=UPI0025477069|nr:DNA repair protein rhp26 [Penicillium macrosclerotiorum]KAJ5675676.1 DNA repair protein rhp26 [Penicillium macrosclerotiorum]
MASPATNATAEASRLQELNADVRDQDDLERDITRQADKFLAEKAEENDTKRLEKALIDKDKVDSQIRQAKNRLTRHVGVATRHRVENELRNLEARRVGLVKDIKEIQKRIDDRREAQEKADGSHGPGRLPNESRRDYLLRTGKITPFELMATGGQDGPLATLHDALVDAEDQQKEDEEREQAHHDPNASHRVLHRPGFDFDDASEDSRTDSSSKRRKLDTSPKVKESPQTSKARAPSSPDVDSSASYVASEDGSAASEDEEFMPDTVPETSSRKRKQTKAESEFEDLSGVDDGNERIYQARLQKWISRRSAARKRSHGSEIKEEDPDEPEWLKPHPTEPDMDLQNGLRAPGDISKYLFSYQRTGLQWLWELHQQTVGGIIGDEMGLGKTIQAISYLASLHHSNMYTKPAIVVCPATLMKQWVNEFHRWWPPFRVSILHSSGSGMMNLGKESSRENALTSEMVGNSHSRYLTAGQKAAKRIIKRVQEEGHVLVTTYSGLQSYADALVDVDWGCAILDEGHKIRNPDAGITFSCKELRTPHRIILSGTPMQNSLIDLWSLFDFVFPMRLGTLVTFKTQFEIPIRQGATPRPPISRSKLPLTDLPQKSEQVIFCKLTQEQRKIYKRFLASNDMISIMKGKRNSLFGIDILRKVCNHPDLVDREIRSREPDYGEASRSGKMQVLKGLLEVWKDTGHKTLLFAQTRQMLDIIQKFVADLGGFNFRRMDGGTPIKDRQTMVDEFNNDPEIHVFLLTTRVGGIGVNLTGADRVIIYDPDWNPSTDMQARERAWRLGQKRDVTIFRLMMKGTIEEKIYHRQIFKQFLTNKITRDPQQRESFQASDLYDLFSLTEENDKELETTKLFKNADVTYQEADTTPIPKHTRRAKPNSPLPKSEDVTSVQGVANIEEFNTESDDKDENGNPKTAEDRIMHGIFARSGVHTALQHDQIVNGKRVVRADPKMIEAEARRVAAEAAEELRKAEIEARSVPIGLPTWTGQFGVAGRSDHAGASSARPAGAGPSSFNLLSRLNPGASLPVLPTTPTGPSRMPRGKDFMPLIRDFFLSRRGPVFTPVIVDHFNHYCTNEQRVAEFQEMLKTVATLDRDRGGRGRWMLKPEFARKS